ncbi:MAG: hypothetical protein FJ290_19040 [Planctomycetes bacterium]|nr:hypothetical protein [Planctomycetota bacterium]
MSFCIVDTGVFCNLIPVPGRDQDVKGVCDRFAELVRQKTTLVLPVAAILETGNLIAQCSDGNARYRTACEFMRVASQAILGETPFVPTPLFDAQALLNWLADFPQGAAQGKGVGDLTIEKEFQRLCALYPGHRVFIWSTDHHLSGYDRPARAPFPTPESKP